MPREIETDTNHELSLKDQLFAEKLSPKEFLDLLMQNDQSTPDRIAAEDNVSLLEDEGIKQYIFEKSELDLEYYNLLSFSNFHVAQKFAFEGDNQKALEYFNKSLDSANHINEPAYQGWQEYVKGTVAYFTNNLEQLSQSRSLVTDPNNRNILDNMYQQLMQSKEIDYKKVY